MNSDTVYRFFFSRQVYRHFTSEGEKLTPGAAWDEFSAQFNRFARRTGAEIKVFSTIQSIPNETDSPFSVHVLVTPEDNQIIAEQGKRIGSRPLSYVWDLGNTALKSMGLRMNVPIVDVNLVRPRYRPNKGPVSSQSIQ